MADLLRPPTNGPARLRALLATRSAPVPAPGAYDALTARLVEQAGFPCVYMTGFGTAASLLGRPDVGLLTFSEMVDNVRRIVRAVDVPVVADADTGYGNAVNVIRTVQEYEQAGVAGLHLEDQVMPKRCGHMSGKQVIPRDEMVGKLRAAAAARSGSATGPLLIARTDARAVESLDATLDRARAYRDAGADLLFVEALTGHDEIERVATDLHDVPLVFNWVDGGRTPPLPATRLAELGYALVLFPITALLVATGAVQQALSAVREAGTPLPLQGTMPSFDAFTATIGLPEVDELSRRFGSD